MQKVHGGAFSASDDFNEHFTEAQEMLFCMERMARTRMALLVPRAVSDKTLADPKYAPILEEGKYYCIMVRPEKVVRKALADITPDDEKICSIRELWGSLAQFQNDNNVWLQDIVSVVLFDNRRMMLIEKTISDMDMMPFHRWGRDLVLPEPEGNIFKEDKVTLPFFRHMRPGPKYKI